METNEEQYIKDINKLRTVFYGIVPMAVIAALLIGIAYLGIISFS